MEREDILNKLKGIIAIIKPKLDLGTVTEASMLTTDLGLDSLSMLLTSLAIEKEFEIKFEPALPPAKVSDVLDYISEKK